MASDVESSTSLSSAGDLSLTCSFSPLESEESAGEESEDAFGTGTVEPYAYEPVASGCPWTATIAIVTMMKDFKIQTG